MKIYATDIKENVNHSRNVLHKANSSDTEARFLDLHLTISDGFFFLKFMINATILILIL